MVHEIKIDNSYANAIIDGRKNFEVRFNDRGYNAGDKIKFEVTKDCPSGIYIDYEHPLHECIFNITYVHSGFGLKEGYVVFGIEPETENKIQGYELENPFNDSRFGG